MGFCFPGTGKTGDLPPRPECAPAWRGRLMAHLPRLQLTLVIGRYAQLAYFPRDGRTLTELVRSWREHPAIMPLPHPSPRSEEHTSELQSLMRISYAVFCLKKKTQT